jgi:hypothetical protein
MPWAVLLQMNKGAGELDQPFVEGIVWSSAVREPELLEHVMRFVKQPAIEAPEVSEIMRGQFLALALFNQRCNLRAFLAHGQS